MYTYVITNASIDKCACVWDIDTCGATERWRTEVDCVEVGGGEGPAPDSTSSVVIDSEAALSGALTKEAAFRSLGPARGLAGALRGRLGLRLELCILRGSIVPPSISSSSSSSSSMPVSGCRGWNELGESWIGPLASVGGRLGCARRAAPVTLLVPQRSSPASCTDARMSVYTHRRTYRQKYRQIDIPRICYTDTLYVEGDAANDAPWSTASTSAAQSARGRAASASLRAK